MSGHTVYRLYDVDDRLLYVGCTGNLAERLAAHAAVRPWWGDVHRMEAESYRTRDEALDVEAGAIVRRKPVYNLQHNSVRTNCATLQELRLAAGLTKTQLARMTDIDRTHLHRIETGERTGTPAQLAAIAAALKVSVRTITEVAA